VTQPRQLLLLAAVLSLLTLLCIFVIDEPVARMISPAATRGFVDPAITGIEYAFGFPVSKWLTGFVLLLIATALFFVQRHRPLAWLLLFAGLSQLTTRLVAGVLKNVFLRTRPYEGLPDRWFTDGGSAFPSGHAAHFWGLFFALSIVFPRLRIPLLVLALFVSLSRVLVNDHFVGDVIGSAAIAALVTAGFVRAFRNAGVPPAGRAGSSPP